MSVDILLAAYNGEKYIEKQIDSVLNQTFEDWRLIICDDCSQDGTAAIIKEYCARFPEKISSVYNERNLGAKETFFKLLEMSRGEYIMFCDQDDVWDGDKISRTLDCMKKNENGAPLLVHTDLFVIDENGSKTAESMFGLQAIDSGRTALNQLLVQNTVTGCTSMINRALADIIKKPSCATLHDWWIALTACLFGSIVFLPETTMGYRRHGENIRGAKNMSSLKYILSRAGDAADAKAMLRLGYEQSAELAGLYGGALDAESLEMLRAYGSCLTLGKLERLGVIKKYGIWKQGCVRILGQLIYL